MQSDKFFFLSVVSIVVLFARPLVAGENPWNPHVDEVFIARAIGKTVGFESPKVPVGMPNCVATALRAGGYLPAFALSGTDSFYDRDLPGCFKRLDSRSDRPKLGDIGTIYAANIPSLAHAVLFLDSDTVFEKPSPNRQDVFRKNSWRTVISNSEPSVRAEVWRYTGGKTCVLEVINENYQKLPSTDPVIIASRETDDRIFNNEWQSNAVNESVLRDGMVAVDADVTSWFQSLGREFNIQQDWNSYRWFIFRSDVLNLLLNTPAYQTR